LKLRRHFVVGFFGFLVFFLLHTPCCRVLGERVAEQLVAFVTEILVAFAMLSFSSSHTTATCVPCSVSPLQTKGRLPPTNLGRGNFQKKLDTYAFGTARIPA
jgi:hypothetical protein